MCANGIANLLNIYRETKETEVTTNSANPEMIQTANSSVSIQQELKDLKTQYLHILVVQQEDECSIATIDDLVQLNRIMKNCTKNFKTANICYQGKGNKSLESKLSLITVSQQKNTSEQSDTKMMFCNSKNISDKMVGLVSWFNGDE